MSEKKSQIELLEYLEKIDKNVENISIKEPMSGELDLSVFKKDNGFSKLKHLEFSPGNITGIRNIPKELETLNIEEQTISALPSIPNTLIELNVGKNNLGYLDLKDATHLKILRCKNNKLTVLENLPRSLEELNIENNQLKQLDLNKMTNLTRLYCSNNPLLVITNQPDTIVDFQCTNSPLIGLNEGQEKGEKTKQSTEKKLNYTDSVNEYFKIKAQYEKDQKKKRGDLIKSNIKNGMSRKQAIRDTNRKIKAKCIYCGRPVTTIFSSENGRYTAICGDRVNPCPLNIELYRGSMQDIEYMIEILKESIDEIKEKIIRQKMDTLFSYITEEQSMNIYKKQMTEYTENSDMYGEYLNKYKTIFHSEMKTEIIDHKKKKIHLLINAIKLKLQDYTKTENIEILNNAVEMYHKDLYPEIDGLRKAKYDIMEMDEFQLIQRDRDIRKMENYLEDPSVIQFNVKKS
jgi:hypothetical protein